MRSFSSPFKNLKSLPLLSGLTVLITVSCATRSAPTPLSPEFRQFLVRWEKDAPLCAVDSKRFESLVKETSAGATTRDPQKISQLLERIDWRKERAMRLEAAGYLAKLPAAVPDEDYALLVRFGCKYTSSYAAVSALVKSETSQANRAPAKRSMKAIEKYVDSGPATGIVQLLLQWSVLRELSISPYYSPKVPAGLAAEMDRFATQLKSERQEASQRADPRDNFEAYSNFRKDTLQAGEVQKSYDAIVFKLRGVMFR
ncbi:MAG: hypothetical protein ABIR96_07545 [Bdellovibrionota bacterium]